MWLEHAAEKTSLNDDKRLLAAVVAHLGENTLVGALNLADTDKLRTALRKTVTRTGRAMEAGTVNRHLTVLKSALTYAEDNGAHLRFNPKKIRFLDENNERDRVCTPAEYALLVAAAPGDLSLIIAIAYRLPLRLGEIGALEWAQVDFAAKRIKLRPTEGGRKPKPRVVRLSPAVVDALKAVPRNLDGRLFSTKTGTLSSQFSKLAKKLNIDDLHLHDFRHTAITNLRRAGVDIFTVKRISGHKTLKMLERYNTIDEADIEKAVQALDALLADDERKAADDAVPA